MKQALDCKIHFAVIDKLIQFCLLFPNIAGNLGSVDGDCWSAHIENIARLAGIVNKKIHKMAKKSFPETFCGNQGKINNPEKRDCDDYFYLLHGVQFVYFGYTYFICRVNNQPGRHESDDYYYSLLFCLFTQNQIST